jgi:hypothetical protein
MATRSRDKFTTSWETVETIYQIWADMGEIDKTDLSEDDTKRILQEYDRLQGRVRQPSRGSSYDPEARKDPYEGVMARRERELIRYWLNDRRRWSPVIDEVAVARFERTRARSAYDALTHRERELIEVRFPALDIYSRLPDGWDPQEWDNFRSRANRKRSYRAKVAA